MSKAKTGTKPGLSAVIRNVNFAGKAMVEGVAVLVERLSREADLAGRERWLVRFVDSRSTFERWIIPADVAGRDRVQTPLTPAEQRKHNRAADRLTDHYDR